MQQFYRINNLVGWGVFAIALLSYTLTMEPTVSFWDCGEFISAAYKLEIVHPPGSPLHAIVGRVFTLISPGDAAWMMNFFSALASAFCILFSFWSISYLARKALGKRGQELDVSQTIAVMGAGAVGALAATYLDSFWFSAIEAEVYAFAAFFSFAMIWAMLKWDYNADKPYGDRWLVLIALLTGLGVGVHLLHLLVIPGLAFIYYFRRYDFTWKGAIITFLVGFGILAIVLWGVLDYFVRIAARVDFLFVNSFGLPLASGFFFFLLLAFGLGVYFIYYARKRNIQWLQLSLLSFLMVIIGFSSYSMVILRSNANPPINMNEPKDPYTLHSYLKREQYGSRPLLYGPYFTATPVDFKEVGTRYRYSEEESKYIAIGKKTEYKYDEASLRSRYPGMGPGQIAQIMEANKMTLFPRMGSNLNQDHARQYRAWLGLRENEMPDFGDNINFFFKYQLGYMYWRYFLWNFAGRQDDIQGHIDRGRANGNWISGIPFIDNMTAGVHMKQPESMASDARNKFYLLPLILGLIGFFYHFRKDKQMAFVVLLLFLFTGIMNIVNSNQPPSEPRERDYAVAISFVLFAYWIGMGVLAIFEGLKDRIPARSAAVAAIVVSMLVPGILVAEGWTDHNRSNRYLARDSAIAYLESVAPNAILFTQGDNDTYPLWYAQEVEGIRTDVRIVNLSLLAVDWYVDQLHNKINDADPVKLRFTDKHYMGDRLLQTQVDENQRFIQQYGNDLDNALNYVKEMAGNPNVTPDKLVLPIRNFVVPLDTNNPVLASMVPDQFANSMVSELRGSVGGQNKNTIVRDEMIILDIVASNFPERPIYFSVTVDRRKHMGLSKYMQREGLAWRLIPANPPGTNREFNNTDMMFDNIVNKWKWGNLDSEDHVYMEETAMRTAKMLRGNLIFLAQVMASEGKKEKARQVLALLEEKFPTHNVPYTAIENVFPVINTHVNLGDMEKAKAWTEPFFALAQKEVAYNYEAGDLDNLRKRFGNAPDFLFRMNNQQANQMNYYGQQLFNNLSVMNSLIQLYRQNGDTEYARTVRDNILAMEQELDISLLDPSLREM